MNYKEISKEELEKKIFEGLSQKELASYFKVSENTIRKKLKINKLKSKRPRCAHRTSEEKELKMVELYLGGKSSSKIGKELDEYEETVLKVLRRHGVKIRSNYDSIYKEFQIDETYLEVIDTEEKAYFLGLFAADGCMRKQNYCINICLNQNDHYLLEFFNQKLYKTKHELGMNGEKMYRLSLHSKKMYYDLIKLGFTDRKSLTLKFPTPDQVPDHLIHHFIRGYFDGDGCITCGFFKTRHYNQFKANVNLVGSEDFICSIRGILSKIIKTSLHVAPFKHSPRCFRILFSAKKSIKIFHDYIYKDSTIFMKRKKIKFDFFFKNANIKK